MVRTNLLAAFVVIPLCACVGDNTVTPTDGGSDQTAPPPDAGKDSTTPTDSGTDAGGDVVTDAPVVCNADAGEANCNNTCVVTATSATNCGACGHDCLGGTCVASLCQPITLATLTHDAKFLATDGTYVAFTVNDTTANGGGVYTVSVSGTNQTPTSIQTADYGGVVAMHSGTVYFVGQNPSNSNMLTLYKGTAGQASSGSATAKTFGSPSAWAVGGIVLNSAGTTLGFASAATGSSIGQIGACPVSNIGSCNSASVTETAVPSGLVTDDSYLYWSDHTAGKIQKMPIAVGTVTDFVSNSQSNVGHVVYDSSYVYWSSDGGGYIYRSPTTSPSQAQVATVNSPNGMAVDSKYVYISGGTGPIQYVPVTGGTPTDLAPASNSREMARDSTALYYYNGGDKTLRKVALPL